jgi:hypothetical protein
MNNKIQLSPTKYGVVMFLYIYTLWKLYYEENGIKNKYLVRHSTNWATPLVQKQIPKASSLAIPSSV